MNEWDRKEAEILWKEGAYARSLTPFQRLIDGHLSYIGCMILLMPVAMGIGLLIGLVL